MCGFAFHAAVLSEPSVWLSCKSRAGSAEGVLIQEVGEGGVARRDERFCMISDSVRDRLFTVPGVLCRIYEYYLDVLLAPRLRSSGWARSWHRLAKYHITIL